MALLTDGEIEALVAGAKAEVEAEHPALVAAVEADRGDGREWKDGFCNGAEVALGAVIATGLIDLEQADVLRRALRVLVERHIR
jgi:hypothetical protein